MSLWWAALLGLVQGLTEFLPVSSTAHLRVVPALLGQPDPGAAFTAVLQLGTLVAVIVYLRRELGEMILGVLRRSGAGLALAGQVVAGTLPIAVLGILAKPFITGDARSLWVVAVALIVFGGIMAWADRRATERIDLPNLTWTIVGAIGFAQALALIPGVSRSGATITAALLLGVRRDDAARFSFLLSIPAIAGAGVFEFPDAFAALAAGARESGSSPWAALGVGVSVAGVSGYISIAWLMGYLRRHRLSVFVGYRVLLGAVILALLATHVLVP